MGNLNRKQPGQPELYVPDSPKLWTLFLTFLTFGILFGIALVSSFVSTTSVFGFLSFIVEFFVVAGYLITGLISFGIGIWHVFNFRWAVVIPCTVVPAAVAMLIAFPGVYREFVSAADYVHFAVFRQNYRRVVDATPKTDGPRLLWFFWTDASPPLAGETLVFLVYDESDELRLPAIQRSDAWKARLASSFKKTGFFQIGSCPIIHRVT